MHPGVSRDVSTLFIPVQSIPLPISMGSSDCLDTSLLPVPFMIQVRPAITSAQVRAGISRFKSQSMQSVTQCSSFIVFSSLYPLVQYSNHSCRHPILISERCKYYSMLPLGCHRVIDLNKSWWKCRTVLACNLYRKPRCSVCIAYTLWAKPRRFGQGRVGIWTA